MAGSLFPRGALADLVPDTAGTTGGAGTGATGTGAAGGGTTGPIAATPSLLAPTGIGATAPDVRLGDLAGQMTTALTRPLGGVPNAAGGERAWTLTPQLGLTEEYSSTPVQGGNGRGGEFITTVTPSLAVSGATSRLQADLFYAPNLAFYEPEGSQNRVSQNFNGRVLATLLPQTLFLDLRGTAATQTVTAGTAPPGVVNPSRGNLSQTSSFSASPYALHRFGPWGTGEIGGTIARTTQNALQPAVAQTPAQIALATQAAAASNQNATSYSGHLAFTTGEAFARYNGAALAQLTSFDGTGVLNGAYRNTITLDNGYGITRTITALGKIGYENIHYGGTAPAHISDAVWNVGIRLEPDPLSTITLRYGHQDGLNSFTLDASLSPTARTRIFARYATGLTTQAEVLQNTLATSDLDTQGNPIDHATGAPLVPVGNFFGTQNSLYKTTLGSLTGLLLLSDRDTISASLTSQVQTLVSAGNAAGLAQGSTDGIYGSLNWSHELRPNLVGTLLGQYGTTTTSGVAGSRQNSFVTSVSLTYALTETVSGQLQYTYNKYFGGTQAVGATNGLVNRPNSDQSIILISLVKSF